MTVRQGLREVRVIADNRKERRWMTAARRLGLAAVMALGVTVSFLALGNATPSFADPACPVPMQGNNWNGCGPCRDGNPATICHRDPCYNNFNSFNNFNSYCRPPLPPPPVYT